MDSDQSMSDAHSVAAAPAALSPHAAPAALSPYAAASLPSDPAPTGAMQLPDVPPAAASEHLPPHGAAAAAAATAGSNRKRALDDDAKAALSDAAADAAPDDAFPSSLPSSDHLSKKARSSRDDAAAAPSSAAASASSLAAASAAASSTLDSTAWMADEPVAANAAASAAASAGSPVAASASAPLTAVASMSDVDPGSGSAAAAASSSTSSSSAQSSSEARLVVGPASAHVDLVSAPPLVDTWTERQKLSRAREDNDADRAALLLESAKLNELRNCFQWTNDQLGLPYIPTELLRIVAGYAERVPDAPPALAAIVVSTFDCDESFENPCHQLMRFASEADFRTYVKRLVIDETRLPECLAEIKAEWEVARPEFECKPLAQIESIRSQIASAQDARAPLQGLQLQLHRMETSLPSARTDHCLGVAADRLQVFAERHPAIRSVLRHDSDYDLEYVADWLEEDSIWPSDFLLSLLQAGNAQATIDELGIALELFLHSKHGAYDAQADVKLRYIDAPLNAAVAPLVDSSGAAPRTLLDFFPHQPRRVDQWSEYELEERARADNNEDRAALLLESGRLHELRTCFELAHDRLGLPRMPLDTLELISDYAARIPVAPRVLCVVFSIVRRLADADFDHEILRFECESDFRAHVHRVMIEDTPFAEYVSARGAARPPDFARMAHKAYALQVELTQLLIEYTDAVPPLSSTNGPSWDLSACSEQLGEGGREALAEWEVNRFNEFAAQHPRILHVLSPALIRSASREPEGSFLSQVKAVGSLDTPLEDVATTFQHFLGIGDPSVVSCRFSIVHENESSERTV